MTRTEAAHWVMSMVRLLHEAAGYDDLRAAEALFPLIESGLEKAEREGDGRHAAVWLTIHGEAGRLYNAAGRR